MKAFAIATLLAVGCAAGGSRPSFDCDRTFFISPKFSEREKVVIERAASRWNDITSKNICTVRATELTFEDTIELEPASSNFWQEESERQGYDVVAVFQSPAMRIVVPDGMAEDALEFAVLHEMGHSLWLGHTEPPSVMAAFSGAATDFTMNDIEECRRVNACD